MFSLNHGLDAESQAEKMFPSKLDGKEFFFFPGPHLRTRLDLPEEFTHNSENHKYERDLDRVEETD